MRFVAILLLSSLASSCFAYQTYGYVWNGPIKYKIVKDRRHRLTRREYKMVKASVEAAFNQWSLACSGGFQFEEGEGGIEIVYDKRGWDILDGLFLGYTTFSTNGTQIVSGKIVINAYNYIWHSGGDLGATLRYGKKGLANIDTVMLHEIGHALGMGHCTDNPDFVFNAADIPTMYPYIYPTSAFLHEDDILGIQSLY